MGCAPLLALVVAAAAAAERRVSVLVAAEDPLREAFEERLAAKRLAPGRVTVRAYTDEEAADPIRKGRFLAEAARGDALVAVGEQASDLALRELEDVPLYFFGGALAEGKALADARVSGTLATNVAALLDAARGLWPGRLGLAYTPGYEEVAGWVRSGARARGYDVVERRVSAPREVAPAFRDLLGGSAVVWVVGDPLLMRGAGFQYLVERSLTRHVPVLGTGRWGVERGAFLAYAPPVDALAAEAAGAVEDLARGRVLGPARLRQAPPGGDLLYNQRLAERWGLRVPKEGRWRPVR